MKRCEIRQSSCLIPTPSSHKKKTPSIGFKQPKTFADIITSIDPINIKISCRPSSRPNERFFSKKRTKPLFYNNKENKKMRNPVKYFRIVPRNVQPNELEKTLYEELFDMPCIKSVASSVDLNGMISESYEFIEMNNSSIHPSRIFISQLSNSCATTNRKEQGMKTKDIQDENCNNKENIQNDVRGIEATLHKLKQQIQFSSFNSTKKQSLLKLIIEMNSVLHTKTDYKSYISFVKPLTEVDTNAKKAHPHSNMRIYDN